MRKVLVVAAREYLAAVRTKAFLVGLLFFPVLMVGSVGVQWLLKDLKDVRARRFAVVDRSPGGKLFERLEKAVQERNASGLTDPETGKQVRPAFVLERVAPSTDDPAAVRQQRFELSERVRRKELDGFLEIGPDVYRPAPADAGGADALAVRYQSDSPLAREFPSWAEAVLNAAVREHRAAQAGLSPEELRAVIQPVPLLSKELHRRDPQTGAIEEAPEVNRLARFLIPGGLMAMMLLVVLGGATPLMQGVIEEKMQRIAEVLLGSVRPFPLMLGKLFGMVAVALTSASLYLASAYLAAWYYGLADYLPPALIAWFLAYLVLAVLMFGSLFIAIGAACTDMHETQSLLMPVMLLACLPLFVWTNTIEEPNGAFAQAVSLFPFATPMLMIARQAVPPGIPWWQPPLGVALMLATTLLCVYAAGRIFRVGILLQGKGAKLGDLARWVFRG